MKFADLMAIILDNKETFAETVNKDVFIQLKTGVPEKIRRIVVQKETIIIEVEN